MAKKKKILLLSDDLRMTSGIATVSKEFVFGTMDKFHWVQLGAAVKHPEQGKEIDLGADVRKETGIEDASLKIIPWTGYGDANILRQLIMRHQPDAILHFTDPRYWRWLYEMEAEIRENIPILFYHIWDDLPDPKYNRDYYESCDWLGCISRQTYGIVSRVGKIKTDTNKEIMVETKLTTVKILKNVYSKFKRLSFESDITLQKLVNRAVDKYVEDEDFRNEINDYTLLEVSGSQY